MPQIIKITGIQATLNTTPNTIANSTSLRILNTDGGSVVVTIANNGVNVGSFTLTTNNGEYITKYARDTVVANNNSNVFATPIAFTQ